MAMISEQALHGIIYSWYVSLRLRGLNEDDAINAMAEGWRLSAIAADKHGNIVQSRARELIVLLNTVLKAQKDRETDTEIKDLHSFGKIIKDDERSDWSEEGGTKL